MFTTFQVLLNSKRIITKFILSKCGMDTENIRAFLDAMFLACICHSHSAQDSAAAAAADDDDDDDDSSCAKALTRKCFRKLPLVLAGLKLDSKQCDALFDSLVLTFNLLVCGY